MLVNTKHDFVGVACCESGHASKHVAWLKVYFVLLFSGFFGQVGLDNLDDVCQKWKVIDLKNE